MNRVAIKTTFLMLLVLAFSSFGASVTATVNTIVGADLSGTPALAGLPGSLVQIGAAASSLLLGLTMDRYGRRRTLATGMAIGAGGAIVAAISVETGSFAGFLLGLGLIGFTRSSSQMGRFVAAEVTPPGQRGRAISFVILGGTFGSVLGPQLVDPSGRAAISAGLNEFVGPFGIGVITFLLSAAVIWLFLRPEPRDVARKIAQEFPDAASGSGTATRSLREILRSPTAIVAVAAMVFGQVVMVGLMGITSLHMRVHDHPLTAISIVFSAHTFGMFAFSVVTGYLLDRWGRGPVILAGAAMLFIACAMAPIWTTVLPIGLALFLLGLGWNFCYLGGSALLSDSLTPDERAKTQGANELVIGLTTAVSSFLSGVIFAAGGYTLAGIIGAAASILPFTLTSWWMVRRPAPSAT